MKFSSPFLFATGVLVASAGLTFKLSAAPLPDPLADIDFTASGGATAQYNSNVLSSAGNVGGVKTKFDDYIFTFNPGLVLKYGAIADTTLTFNYTETFYRYYAHPALNEELSNVGFNVDRKQGAFDLSAGFSYAQNYNNTPSSASPGLTSIIRSDVIDAHGNATWNYSDKFTFTGGVDYSQTSYLYSVGKTFQDSSTFTLPFTGYYAYTDQVSVGAGYTYSQTTQQPAPATPGVPGRGRYNNTFTLNTRLTKWNKLTGDADIGVTMNHIDGDSSAALPALDSTTVSYGLNLQYAYTDTVAFTLSGNRNFSTGTTGQNIQATSVGVGVNYDYSSNIYATANLITYTYSQYLQQNRHDDTKTSGITINWKPYSYLTLSAGYSYFMNSSDAPNATYNISIVTVSGTVSY